MSTDLDSTAIALKRAPLQPLRQQFAPSLPTMTSCYAQHDHMQIFNFASNCLDFLQMTSLICDQTCWLAKTWQSLSLLPSARDIKLRSHVRKHAVGQLKLRFETVRTRCWHRLSDAVTA